MTINIKTGLSITAVFTLDTPFSEPIILFQDTQGTIHNWDKGVSVKDVFTNLKADFDHAAENLTNLTKIAQGYQSPEYGPYLAKEWMDRSNQANESFQTALLEVLEFINKTGLHKLPLFDKIFDEAPKSASPATASHAPVFFDESNGELSKEKHDMMESIAQGIAQALGGSANLASVRIIKVTDKSQFDQLTQGPIPGKGHLH